MRRMRSMIREMTPRRRPTAAARAARMAPGAGPRPPATAARDRVGGGAVGGRARRRGQRGALRDAARRPARGRGPAPARGRRLARHLDEPGLNKAVDDAADVEIAQPGDAGDGGDIVRAVDPREDAPLVRRQVDALGALGRAGRRNLTTTSSVGMRSRMRDHSSMRRTPSMITFSMLSGMVMLSRGGFSPARSGSRPRSRRRAGRPSPRSGCARCG